MRRPRRAKLGSFVNKCMFARPPSGLALTGAHGCCGSRRRSRQTWPWLSRSDPERVACGSRGGAAALPARLLLHARSSDGLNYRERRHRERDGTGRVSSRRTRSARSSSAPPRSSWSMMHTISRGCPSRAYRRGGARTRDVPGSWFLWPVRPRELAHPLSDRASSRQWRKRSVVG